MSSWYGGQCLRLAAIMALLAAAASAAGCQEVDQSQVASEPEATNASSSHDPARPTAPLSGPRIAFANLVPRSVPFGDTTIEGDMLDLGTLGSTLALTDVLSVRNIGDAPLIIGDITAPCPCIAVDPPVDPVVAPGDEIALTVWYNATGVEYGPTNGPLHHIVRIGSNDPTSPVTEVSVTVSMP